MNVVQLVVVVGRSNNGMVSRLLASCFEHEIGGLEDAEQLMEHHGSDLSMHGALAYHTYIH